MTITLNLEQARKLLACFGDEDASISVQNMDGHSGNGNYAYFSDYPEVGCVFLGEVP